MADGIYLKGLEQTFLGNIDFESATIKAIFLSPSHTFDFTGDSFLSDISADRASGTTDITLTGVSVNIDVANSRIEIDSNDFSDTSITATTDKFALYDATSGVDSTSPLICGIEFTEGTLSPVAGTLAVTVNAQGFFSIAKS